MTIEIMANTAKNSSIELSVMSSEMKNNILKSISDALLKNIDIIESANNEDILRSQKENLSIPLLKRLKFDKNKIQASVDGMMDLIKLDDPVGITILETELDNELQLRRISCPIGLIGVIFESRPDALIQISSLCVKSGNSVLLKGGSEAQNTNKVLYDIINKASLKAGAPEGWIVLAETRDDVNNMLKLDKTIDLIIPRGSNEFVKYIMDNSKIPVLGHADGICHCFVDVDAELDMAVRVVDDSKTQYVAVCNALETLLVHQDIAETFLPALKKQLDIKGVKLIGCDKTSNIIECDSATESDWRTEYLDYILSIKIVKNVSEAVKHINKYGSGHTDSIVTANQKTAEYFMNYVDSGNVFWNCSTRFSDGFRYGFGAEVGVSTNKIHARGPVGLDGLVTYKYKLIGNGHLVDDYANNTKTFKHKKININQK